MFLRLLFITYVWGNSVSLIQWDQDRIKGDTVKYGVDRKNNQKFLQSDFFLFSTNIPTNIDNSKRRYMGRARSTWDRISGGDKSAPRKATRIITGALILDNDLAVVIPVDIIINTIKGI